MNERRASFLILLTLLLLPGLVLAAEPSPEASEFFEKKIRPVLVQSCYKCHSADAKKLKGELRVDSLAALLKGGESGPSLVPGHPEKSKLIEAISYKNTELLMPPQSKLDDAVIADLTKWIQMGAPWPGSAAPITPTVKTTFDLERRKREHWSWQPIRPTPPPVVKNAKWPLTPPDAFILAGLERAGVVPAPEADPRTWVRRVTFDLIGLPPTPQEITDFLKDERPDAREKVVDRLLASPAFGERWARHWFDLVRYGETRGHEFEPILPNAYQYRDYVIRAFNADVPYDHFVMEHLAGDLLPAPRLHPTEKFNESILGTGFWLLGEEVHSPVDIRLDQADRFDNRIDVMTKTFLGLTVSCARCHDHKFDAISARDYYSLFTVLESGGYRLARFDSLEHNRKIAQEMDALRDRCGQRWKAALDKRLQPTVEHLADYLLAARAGLLLGPELSASKASDVIFEDFEKGTYEGWTVTGTAFGDKPQTLDTIAPYQGRINAVGKYFVNSHNIRKTESVGAGDAHKGTLTSRTFTIDHAAITMLVGGGAHAGRTCVNLLLDGKVVRTATGRDNNQMFPVRWDVRPFKGKTARIQIVDDESGPWGNIGVDHIVFTDRPDTAPDSAVVRTEEFSPAYREALEKLASDRKLNPTVLTGWVGLLLQASRDPDHWLHAWARAATDKLGTEGKPFTEGLRPLLERLKQRQAEAAKAHPETSVIIDYRQASPSEWMPDDVTFGSGPRRAGEVRLDGTPERPEIRLEEQGAACYDRMWDGLTVAPGNQSEPGSLGRMIRAGRTLRTPSFIIESDRVHYLVRGNGLAYAAVSNHVMIQGPLHGELVMPLQGGKEFRWVSQDLRRYKGLRTHVEFTAAPGSDFAVVMVAQGPQVPTLIPSVDPRLIRALADESATPATLAQAYQKLFTAGSGEPAKSSVSLQHARLLNSLLERPELLAGAAEAVRQMEDIAAEWSKERTRLTGQIKRESRLAMALLDGNGVNGNVFIRGSHKAPGEPVQRRLLEALAGKETLAGPGSGRLALARQMIDPAVNPYITRVMVNRVWHHLFGQGIVPSVDNFGVLGELPTHPELLDSLADGFARDGWSIKKLIRTLVLSRTYRMSGKADDQADQADPQNRLLHRMRVRRLEGEAIRDALLQLSGRLDARMGGPSVPIHLTPFLEGRGRPASGPLDGNGRRSIYLAITRNFLSPFMLAFDTPIPFSTVGRRTVSNVPAQALILLNDPFVHSQTDLWGRRVAAQKSTTNDRIEGMYLSAFGRPATEAERKVCQAFLDQQMQANKTGPDNPAPWIDLAHTLVNVKEFIYLH